MPRIESKIRGVFQKVFYEKNIELIGISSETEQEATFDENKKRLTERKLKYTAALKQGKILFPVEINESDSEEDIKNSFLKGLEDNEVVV
ncbi:hypothetical protein BH10BAC5_BH10BAC5_27270 [soil metagenome]